jgi:predicted metalloprotease
MKLGKMRRRQGADGVIDRRSAGPTGGGRGLPIGVGGMGIGGLILIAVLVFVLPRVLGDGGPDLGGLGDAMDPFGQAGGEPVGSQEEVNPDDPTGRFVDLVSGDVNYAWAEIFDRGGQTYEDPDVVLYRGSTQTGCGLGRAGMGPFYCPPDRTVYLDPSFFKELETQLGAPGDFAEAYVIAHEIGHHVQTLLGIERQVRQLQRDYPDEANDLSVRMELQADCFAGVWGRSAQAAGILQPGDIEEGLNAASQIGDDVLMEEAGIDADPDAFTHGTAEQRATWLRTGIQVGNPDACDTFNNDI